MSVPTENPCDPPKTFWTHPPPLPGDRELPVSKNKYFTDFTEVKRCYVQPFVLP